MTRTSFAAQRAPAVDSDRVLVSKTHLWLRYVPPWHHPKRLCRHYPRLANKIAGRWHDRTLVARLLVELIFDRRGGRLGFPVRIMDELRALATINAKLDRADRRKWTTTAARLLGRTDSPKALA